jgi:hypothetical protein
MADQVIFDCSIPRFTDSDSVPFSRSYWVVRGKLLAGCYPGSENGQEAAGKLKGMLEHGIRHVINLMEPNESNREMRPFVPYEGSMKSIANSMDLEVSLERIPIRDGWVPSHGDMVAILDSVDSHVDKGKAVYVHCWGGRGRTGTVVACYLIRHGLCEASEAVGKIRDLRRFTEDQDEPSPESRRQCEMILSWVEGE